ncbi:MAG TPA: SRPBCC family protein [Opitutaceae bacterium]|nr:SRPBCC family protein [Opitutaceae bacterium]
MKRPDVAKSKIVVHDDRGIKVVKSLTIRRPAQELYEFWRDLSNLPRIIHHPVRIAPITDIESHWEVSAPGGEPVQWDALIINDEPGRLIAWRSREGDQVPNAGSVRFEPSRDGLGTEVTVKLDYDPPGGRLGALIASFTRDAASQQVGDALKRFKELAESGQLGSDGNGRSFDRTDMTI